MESLYRRHRFPPEIISHAVWLYHRFALSFRDAGDLLAERGVAVSGEAIRSWCRKFGAANARTPVVGPPERMKARGFSTERSASFSLQPLGVCSRRARHGSVATCAVTY